MPLKKSIFRENCIKKIKNASPHSRYYRNAMINKHLLRELKKIKGAKVLFYYPLPFEADIRKSINKMRKNCDIFVPFMQDSSFKIVPFRLPLKKKNFGIYEAGNTIRNIKKIINISFKGRLDEKKKYNIACINYVIDSVK